MVLHDLIRHVNSYVRVPCATQRSTFPKILSLVHVYLCENTMMIECTRFQMYHAADYCQLHHLITTPDSNVYGADLGPIWGRQNPGGHHVGPMNFAIRDYAFKFHYSNIHGEAATFNCHNVHVFSSLLMRSRPDVANTFFYWHSNIQLVTAMDGLITQYCIKFNMDECGHTKKNYKRRTAPCPRIRTLEHLLRLCVRKYSML